MVCWCIKFFSLPAVRAVAWLQPAVINTSYVTRHPYSEFSRNFLAGDRGGGIVPSRALSHVELYVYVVMVCPPSPPTHVKTATAPANALPRFSTIFGGLGL